MSIDLSTVDIVGPVDVLASRYNVTALAANSVAEASLAAAELLAVRTGEPVRRVRVDRVAACAAFAGERLFQPSGWQLPPIWDPIAGDYRAADGWIRLHTNYANHRAAALRALALAPDCDSRDEVAAAVLRRAGAELESVVVAEGGAAARLRSTANWLDSPEGRAGHAQRQRSDPAPPVPGALVHLAPADLPLTGVRVLDLTRVIAGPACTRFLAAYGAKVVRIDPPDFAEVPALIPEVTPGKRCATLDLRKPADRERFAELVAQADVIVGGLRDGALQGLGLGPDRLRGMNPALIIARLNAYGWDGPWSRRRGFDSLVQMSCGIACLDTAGLDTAGLDTESVPSPLPVQALDHATGYLLAASICRALTALLRTGIPAEIRMSLIATANTLRALPASPGPAPADPDWPDEVFETVPTAWGPARRVRVPGSVDGIKPSWTVDAGPLGRHEPRFD